MIKYLEKLLRHARKQRAGAKKRLGAAKKHESAGTPLADWRRVGAAITVVLALSFLMSVHLVPDKISLRLGDISAREVRAGRSVRYFDSVATERRQQAARLETPPVYDTDEHAPVGANHTVQQIFDNLERVRANARSASHTAGKITSHKESLAVLQSQIGADLNDAQLRYLLTVPPAVLQKLRDTTMHRVSDAMDREIRDLPSDLPHARREVEMAAQDELFSRRDAAIVGVVAARALRPNHLLDRHKTDLARETASRNVSPVYGNILRDDKIIGPNEIVTQEHLDKFTALGLLNPRMELRTIVAICLLAAAMVFLVSFYIQATLPKLYNSTRQMSMLALIIFISVFGLKVGATLLGLSFSSGQVGYLGVMSVAAAGMLVSVLLDMHLAMLIVALLSVQSGLIMNHEIRFTVMSLMSSLVGIVAVGSGRDKINLQRATASLALANLTLVWLLGLLLGESLTEMLTGSAWAVGSAAFATFLFWFGVLMLEKPFGILTHTTLLEMSAFDRPLLKQLCAVAPGTYAHSMMVGTLAESAAQALGVDALLCRVGGYYHDIGKMKRPEFFVENQRNENVHGRLSPSLSALIITAHVRDGVEMAIEHRLPAPIRDMIAQHHGTTLIRYFYHQALMDNTSSGETSPGLEERFRYPGPRPQTREAAVVMLADSVEAAARCLDKPTPERLEALIANIVRDKIEDGQFDQCSLTFQDIRGIKTAFLHVLTAMMHGRIDYPEAPTQTGTGLPMEVVRPDLRPEPAALEQASVREYAQDPDADKMLYGEIEPSAPKTEHDTDAPLEAISRLNFRMESEQKAEEAWLSSMDMEAVTRPPLTPHPLPRMEPEVLYGRLTVEHPESTGQADRPASGGAPPPANGRSDPRRG